MLLFSGTGVAYVRTVKTASDAIAQGALDSQPQDRLSAVSYDPSNGKLRPARRPRNPRAAAHSLVPQARAADRVARGRVNPAGADRLRHHSADSRAHSPARPQPHDHHRANNNDDAHHHHDTDHNAHHHAVVHQPHRAAVTTADATAPTSSPLAK